MKRHSSEVDNVVEESGKRVRADLDPDLWSGLPLDCFVPISEQMMKDGKACHVLAVWMTCTELWHGVRPRLLRAFFEPKLAAIRKETAAMVQEGWQFRPPVSVGQSRAHLWDDERWQKFSRHPILDQTPDEQVDASFYVHYLDMIGPAADEEATKAKLGYHFDWVSDHCTHRRCGYQRNCRPCLFFRHARALLSIIFYMGTHTSCNIDHPLRALFQLLPGEELVAWTLLFLRHCTNLGAFCKSRPEFVTWDYEAAMSECFV